MGRRDRERRQRIKTGQESGYQEQAYIDSQLKKFSLYEDFTGTLLPDSTILLRRKPQVKKAKWFWQK
ncbi:MAG: hypothetical protein Q8O55_08895 [Dehalococcoidales bacterium]|nr:hypothetical protein [Dehalococcoidales bacterium]